ncbi:Hypothetical protein ZOBELLIA_377 [Zobellia galactanivorans]|uniref:Uncharacterized protein n=1 Tax=Zobellia galactanivorans (strain DSM 12802 / CCUG 47099 / CIP 106680 / NCIMB 13871 / Dsij) TaxID=63186 RepID=G0L9A1_ZOBGA|nr:Hypothetical protein ZOBELLIA_377 [Zobellia galactanivorans]
MKNNALLVWFFTSSDFKKEQCSYFILSLPLLNIKTLTYCDFFSSLHSSINKIYLENKIIPISNIAWPAKLSPKTKLADHCNHKLSFS